MQFILKLIGNLLLTQNKQDKCCFWNKSPIYNIIYAHREKLNFYKSDELIMLELPYKDDKAHMYVLLPNQETQIDDFCLNLDYTKFCELKITCQKGL